MCIHFNNNNNNKRKIKINICVFIKTKMINFIFLSLQYTNYKLLPDLTILARSLSHTYFILLIP